MILPIQHAVRRHMTDAVRRLYDIPADDPVLAAIPVEIPPRRALGDLSVPLAFELARRLRKAPRAIAQEIVGALGQIDGFTRIEAAPNGYVNFFLDRPAQFVRWLAPRRAGGPASGWSARRQAPGKTIVEHTAINPNKAAHIGHLRNAALGDAFGRLLRFLGREVEIQNYIDDTGVQVADVAVGFRELEHKGLDEVRALADTTRFDYYCWDLYARVTEWYEEDKTRLKIRTAALHDIEHGGNPTADLAAFIADRIVRCHLKTMRRLNIGYDLLTWEGDILRLHFWSHAFEFLKKTGAVFLQTEGRLKGCWVMQIDEDEAGEAPESPPLTCRRRSSDAGRRRHRRAISSRARRSSSAPTARSPTSARTWPISSGSSGCSARTSTTACSPNDPASRPLWSTTSLASAASPNPPAFGRASWVCNVIDTRQSYLQKLLKQALAALGYEAQAEHSVHYAYEMVALSHATARELGYEHRRRGRPAVRRGLRTQGARRQGRRPHRSADREGRERSGEAQSGALARPDAPHRRSDCHRRGPLLHGEVLARQGHHLRHRRGAELRRRKRALPPVRRRARQQHLQQAQGARRHRRGRRPRGGGDRAAPTS